MSNGNYTCNVHNHLHTAGSYAHYKAKLRVFTTDPPQKGKEIVIDHDSDGVLPLLQQSGNLFKLEYREGGGAPGPDPWKDLHCFGPVSDGDKVLLGRLDVPSTVEINGQNVSPGKCPD